VSAAERAIKSALANVEDNLYRWRNFTTPDHVTPNGERVSDIIAALERERDELRKALPLVRSVSTNTPGGREALTAEDREAAVEDGDG
jgi:hypothetical protein